MPAPVLLDYEYQFRDSPSGFTLNKGTVLPFVDVHKVTGLDLPEFAAAADDVDGRHGGAAFIRFSNARTIIIDGTLYADPTTIDATIDTLVSTWIPNDTVYPFYYKHPGITQRYILCKSFGMRYEVDNLRNTGRSAIQFQLIAEDPRKYVDNSNFTMSAGVNHTPVNLGNVEVYPVFTITGAYTTLTLTNVTTSRSIVISEPRTAGQVTVVDLQNREVFVNGSHKSSVISSAAWWDIKAGGGQAIRYTVTGGPPTSVVVATKSGWL